MGPIFRRELVVLSRRRSTYVERAVLAVLVLGVVVACVVVWNYRDADRTMSPGVTRFAHLTYGLVVAVLAVLTLGVVPNEVASGVAGERDRKTLDALLATAMSSAQVVAGATASGLVKWASGLAVGLSVMVLMIPLAGIDPRLVALAFAGLAATAFATAALSVAVSVAARDARQAVALSIAWVWGFWLSLPLVGLILLPRVWPEAARRVYPIALVVLDGSPMGVLTNVVGLYRRSGLIEAVARMIGYEVLGGAVLFTWAVWRLRPASRAVYESEGRSVLRALGKSRWRGRPRCGDDPVFWNEKYSTRGVSDWAWLLGGLVNLALFGVLAVATYHFAAPAFREVLVFGYTAAPGEHVSLEINPLARALVTAIGKGPSLPAVPNGLARHEFNTVLRGVTMLYFFIHVLVVAGYAAESLSFERERDTWPGLIATPLTGREILVAKMLGTAWRLRLVMGGMAGLWLVGLVAGAIHPLGFLAALAGMGVSGGFLLALGSYVSLWSRDRKQATNRVLLPVLAMVLSGLPLVVLPGAALSVLMGVGSMPVIGGFSLLSYEDVRSATGSGAFPFLTEVGIHTGEGVWPVAATCLIGLSAQAVLAWFFSRSAFRGFDAAVGRPVRGRSRARGAPRTRRAAVTQEIGSG